MYWDILGIEPTKDENRIREAYHAKLHFVNPEDDQEGFKELRRAYEQAMEYVNLEDNTEESEEKEDYSYKKKNEVDLWIDRIDNIYQDVTTRRNVEKWNTLLHDPICDDLDTELEAADKLLVYLMGHSYLPQDIWSAVDRRFSYRDNIQQLKERFPENFLDYMKWQIESPTFIDYEMFDGKTDAKVDDYINKLYETKNAEEDGDLDRVSRLLSELSAFEVTHPFTEVEKARYYMMKADKLSKEKEDNCQETIDKLYTQALEVMEELDFEYSDNIYIERTYAQALLKKNKVEPARNVYQGLLEKNEKDFGSKLGIAECIFMEGQPEEAKEQVEEILEDRVQDVECLMLLDRINEVLVKQYCEILSKDKNRDISIKLGWCYYQQKKFDKGIALLDKLEEGDDYDYVNLRSRLYLANEDYSKAYPYARKWLSMIENSVDDGSAEMRKRKNRLSLAHFSIGVCIWEDVYKKETGKKREEAYEDTKRFIDMAIAEENNILVRLSYMEQMARFYIDANAYEECVEICNQIIEKDKGFFPAYVHRQKANYELRNAKDVIDDYFMCIDIYPEYVPPYILAAEVFYAFDQYDDVEKVIQAAKEGGLQSDSLELYRIKCIHYKDFSTENTQKALDALIALRERVLFEDKDKSTDIEDLAELEREYAILYWDLDKVEQTFAIIDAYLKEHPDSDVMRDLKIDVCIREKRTKDALAMAKKMVKEFPDDIAKAMKLANCYERVDQQEKAIELYKKILVKKDDYVPAIRRLMYIYSNLSNQKDDLELCKLGIQYADRMIELTDSSDAYLEKGNLQIDLYELEGAVDSCKKAIERNPDAYYAYNNLGCALLKLRRVDEAVKPLLQAIELDPDREHLPYMNLAECYTLLGEYDKAIEAYENVLRFHPKSESVKESIAKLFIKKGDYERAVAYYKNRIKQIEDKYANVSNLKLIWDGMEEEDQLLSLYCDLADAYRQAGKSERAEHYYEKVILRWKNPLRGKISCRHIANVAEYYRDKGELEKAEKLVRKAYWRSSDESNSYEMEHLMFVTATIMFCLGKQKKAREDAIGYFSRFYVCRGTDNQDKIFENKRHLLANLYDFAIMSLCAGDIKEGKEYIERMRNCNVCVTCECMECFEYYFAMGILAKIEGREEDAKTYFEKAIAIKGDYPCAQYQLSTLKK